jgi:hypothetical protein
MVKCENSSHFFHHAGRPNLLGNSQIIISFQLLTGKKYGSTIRQEICLYIKRFILFRAEGNLA